jgi:hypothetical protein
VLLNETVVAWRAESGEEILGLYARLRLAMFELEGERSMLELVDWFGCLRLLGVEVKTKVRREYLGSLKRVNTMCR